MIPPAPPRRHWFRYSLRTFFVVLTIFGVWLGVQVKWIHDRHEAKSRHTAYSQSIHRFQKWPLRTKVVMLRPETYSDAPWSIRILGETGVATILIDEEFKDEQARLETLFPEAQVAVVFSAD